MTFQDIVNEISRLAPVQILSASSGTDISKVRLWANRPESEEGSILYFGYDSQPDPCPEHYILASDRTDLSESVVPDHPASVTLNIIHPDPAGHSVDLAVIPSRYFATVFNRIQDFMSERTGNDYLHYLMETADKVKSVDTLIDLASQTFNASLILIDRDFRILSHSTRIPVTDELWTDNIKKGYCDYDFITEVRKLKSVQMADPGTTPFEVTCSASPYRKLACKVYCRDAWIGSLLLIEGDHTYRTEHAEMLRILA